LILTVLEALLALCSPDATSKQLCLPGGVVIAEREVLRFQTRPIAAPVTKTFELALSKGELDYPDLGFRLCVNTVCPEQHQTVTQIGKNVYKPFIRDILTFDTIIECDAWLAQNRPILRPRREGDTLLLRGVNRKLRKLQNEVGMPAPLRDKLPLLCLGDTVVWAPFAGVRDGFFAPVTESTRNTLSLTIEILPHGHNLEEQP